MKKLPSIRAFVSYCATFKGAFWLTAATFTVSNVVLALIPWQIGQLADSLANQGNIMLWTILLIASSVGHDMLWRAGEFCYLFTLNTRGQRIDDIIFGEVINHDYRFFVDKFTGKISSYANSLGREFRELLDNFHYNYISLIVTLPVIAVTMFTVNSYTGAIFVVSLLLMYAIGRKLAAIAAAAERIEADKRSSMDGYVVDIIANFVSVKAFGSEFRETQRLYTQRDGLVDAANRAMLKAIWFWGAMSLFVRWIIWPSTFILNVYLFTQGKIDLAQITTFLTAILLFSNFIWEVIWNISQLNVKFARIEEAYRYLFGERNIILEPTDRKVALLTNEHFKRTLELKNLSFAYPDDPTTLVLQGVNLKVERGEKVGIVGPSGGGKSTLFSLLLGHYPLSEGSVLMDGKPVSNQALTGLTSYVPQDTSVFHRSVSDNIAYARPDATREEIKAAAKHAQADGFIAKLNDGYGTLVGERGVKLSGGQRQRIAIARAILKDAPILLLDEATSALDSESEKHIQKALSDLLKNRTALIIAHRLSTIQHMDRIVVFDGGTIAEQGSHRELLAKKGIYAQLWAHQTDGFIED